MAFDPEVQLPPFTVILFPYRFENATISKIFVVLCHERGYAFCIKTTANLAFYQNSPGLLSGCIPYKRGELGLFAEDTVIQPDNQFPISHASLIEASERGALRVLGTMPADFKEKLIRAINSSVLMDSRKKERILRRIPK